MSLSQSLGCLLSFASQHVVSASQVLDAYIKEYSGETVNFNKKLYSSASEALEAYIENFSESNPQRKKYYNRDVNDLLIPKSCLERTADRSLPTSARDTKQEKRLYAVKTMVDRAYKKMVQEEYDRFHVKSALAESSKILNQVSLDDLSSLPSNSHQDDQDDIGSVTTDMLLSVPPMFTPETLHSRHKSGHVYSYKRNAQKAFSKNMPFGDSENMPLSHSSNVHQSQFNESSGRYSSSSESPSKLLSSSSLKDTKSFENRTLKNSQKSNILDSREDRSLNFQKSSPNYHKQFSFKRSRITKTKSPSSKFRRSFSPEVSQPLPSYTDELETSRFSDIGHTTPSWIGNVEKSVTNQEKTKFLLDDSIMSSKEFAIKNLSARDNGLGLSIIQKKGISVPSYIEDLETSALASKGRPAPSYVGDLETSVVSSRSRPVPSFIADLETSALASKKRPIPSYIGDIDELESTVMSQKHDPTPSWIGELESGEMTQKYNSTDTSIENSSKHDELQPQWAHSKNHHSTAPSWVADLEVSECHGRTAPSWIGATAKSDIRSTIVENQQQGFEHHVNIESLGLSKNNRSGSTLSLEDLKISSRSYDYNNVKNKHTDKDLLMIGTKGKRTLSDVSSNTSESTGELMLQSSMGRKSQPFNQSKSRHVKQQKKDHISSRTLNQSKPVEHLMKSKSSNFELKMNNNFNISTPNTGFERNSSEYKGNLTFSAQKQNVPTLNALEDNMETKTTSSTNSLSYQDSFGKQQKLSKAVYSNNETLETFLENLKKSSDHTDAVLSENIEGSTSKSEKGKKSRLSTSSSRFSPETDLILEGDRSWEKIPAYKSPKYVMETDSSPTDKARIVDSFIHDCVDALKKKSSPRLTGREQPGGMEALKNMLFTLQTVATSGGNLDENDEDTSKVPSNTSNFTVNEPAGESLPSATKEVISEQFTNGPGGQSLERAMLHLSRLKTLVGSYDSQNTKSVE